MNYTKEIIYTASAEAVFTAITRKLDQWWGRTDTPVYQVGDEFKTSFGQGFWKFRITEYKPNEKVTWECIEGYPAFEKEWEGTTLHWDIHTDVDETKLSFTHVGLTPSFECYDVCAPTWDLFITKSLKSFVETGVGMPHV